MSKRVDEHVESVPEPGMLSRGGVDATTGATTGAIAGAVLGASGGPITLAAGALIGGMAGALAARGKERPYYPEPWQTRREQLHQEPEQGRKR